MYCKFCGVEIDNNVIVCTKCGKQVQELRTAPQPQFQQPYQQPNIIINNSSTAISGGGGVKPKNKWVALVLCFFLGWLGAHKFYEGKILFGIIYFFTMGLLGVGVFIDFIIIILKPNPYY